MGTNEEVLGARNVHTLSILYKYPQTIDLTTNDMTPIANTMANGKDFFVELRKQVASLQKGGPPVGG